MKKVGTIIAKYNTFVIIALQSYETIIGHQSSMDISALQIMDVVEFEYVDLSVTDCVILRRESNPAINKLLIKVAEADELDEIKLEDVVLAILKGENPALNIAGVRSFKGGTRIITKK